MIRRPPRSTLSSSSAASDVYKRQVLAFRIRVSMSAMGSVIVIVGRLLSPTGLRHAGDLTGMDHHSQADPAQAELAVHRLGCALLLFDQSLLRHGVTGSPVGTGSRMRPAGPGPLRRYVRWWRW